MYFLKLEDPACLHWLASTIFSSLQGGLALVVCAQPSYMHRPGAWLPGQTANGKICFVRAWGGSAQPPSFDHGTGSFHAITLHELEAKRNTHYRLEAKQAGRQKLTYD